MARLGFRTYTQTGNLILDSLILYTGQNGRDTRHYAEQIPT